MSHWRTTAAADVFSLSVLSPKCERPRSFPFGGNLCVYLPRWYRSANAHTTHLRPKHGIAFIPPFGARVSHTPSIDAARRPPSRRVVKWKIHRLFSPPSAFYLWRPPSAKQQLVVKMHSTLFGLFIPVCMSLPDASLSGESRL